MKVYARQTLTKKMPDNKNNEIEAEGRENTGDSIFFGGFVAFKKTGIFGVWASRIMSSHFTVQKKAPQIDVSCVSSNVAVEILG